MRVKGEGVMSQQRSAGWVDFVAWCIRHWILVLVLVVVVIGIVSAIIPNESDHPRSGYVDTGEQVTEQQCLDQGGQPVGDVCYGP